MCRDYSTTYNMYASTLMNHTTLYDMQNNRLSSDCSRRTYYLPDQFH